MFTDIIIVRDEHTVIHDRIAPLRRWPMMDERAGHMLIAGRSTPLNHCWHVKTVSPATLL